MINSLKITSYIIEILKSDEELYNYLKNSDNSHRIYPIDAVEGTQFPFIVVQRTGIQPVYNKDGNYGDSVYVSVVIVSDKYEQSVDLAEMVRKTLEYRHLRFEDGFEIRYSKISNINETIYQGAYVQQIDFIFEI